MAGGVAGRQRLFTQKLVGRLNARGYREQTVKKTTGDRGVCLCRPGISDLKRGMCSKMGCETSSLLESESSEERRKRFANELAMLREKALSDLEARGYAVRGKTPAQIRRALKNRPRKRNGAEH